MRRHDDSKWAAELAVSPDDNSPSTFPDSIPTPEELCLESFQTQNRRYQLLSFNRVLSLHIKWWIQGGQVKEINVFPLQVLSEA